MINFKRVLALIPARGGSKSIPLKNIQPCGGRPLIAWTIEAATNSKYVDRIAVTTDSKDISDAARAAYRLTDVIDRPPELSRDETEMAPVISHALAHYKHRAASEIESQWHDIAVLLQPTSPLRTAEDIDAALDLLESSGADTVTSVYESYSVPFTGVDPPRRQDRKPTLFLNGAVYAFRVGPFLETRELIDARTMPYVMPQARSVDVDYPIDLAVAGAIIGSAR